MADQLLVDALLCSLKEWNKARTMEGLRGANLRGANLRDADLPPPGVFLLAAWGRVSDGLTRDLMRYDAESHPEPEKFDGWAAGGDCPYDSCRWQRAADFEERREAWEPGRAPRVIELAERLIEECTKTEGD